MEYNRVETSLKQVIRQSTGLTAHQTERLGDLCVSLLLAGETSLRKLARQLPAPHQQDSRVRWLQRLLGAPFMCWSAVYHPFIAALLAQLNTPELHLVMDRTDLLANQYDLLTLNLSYRRRALPICWQLRPTGMTGAIDQIRLLTLCDPLIPTGQPVIFHGDNEFGSVAVMRWLHQHGWDYILGQSAKNYARSTRGTPAFQLGQLPVTRTQPVYRYHLQLTKRYWWGPLNLFAFYHPVHHRGRRKQAVRYYATSLPAARNWRQLGKRRWGVECYYRDLKSSGWNLTQAQIDPQKRLPGLVLALNLLYAWATCVGRWLCKTSQRQLVDAKPRRHLSLFRIGWDWLVFAIRNGLECPVITRLYS
jgi:hypothetical protein